MARDIKKILRLLLIVFRLIMKRANIATIDISHIKIVNIKTANIPDIVSGFVLSAINIIENKRNRDRIVKIHLLIFNFDGFIFTGDLLFDS
jgi:hypothetical protein